MATENAVIYNLAGNASISTKLPWIIPWERNLCDPCKPVWSSEKETCVARGVVIASWTSWGALRKKPMWPLPPPPAPVTISWKSCRLELWTWKKFCRWLERNLCAPPPCHCVMETECWTKNKRMQLNARHNARDILVVFAEPVRAMPSRRRRGQPHISGMAWLITTTRAVRRVIANYRTGHLESCNLLTPAVVAKKRLSVEKWRTWDVKRQVRERWDVPVFCVFLTFFCLRWWGKLFVNCQTFKWQTQPITILHPSPVCSTKLSLRRRVHRQCGQCGRDDRSAQTLQLLAEGSCCVQRRWRGSSAQRKDHQPGSGGTSLCVQM